MDPPLPIDGVLPPDLQGMLVRIGPGGPGTAAAGDRRRGALHAIELRDGAAISYTTTPSSADANVFWQAEKLLALAESGLPQQFSRLLAPEDFDGGLTVPVASHVHRDASTGGRILFGVEQGTETAPPLLRVGEWDAGGSLTHRMEVQLERATWQHDLGVTARQIAFIESATAYSDALGGDAPDHPDGQHDNPDGQHDNPDGLHDRPGVAVPYRWTPGAPGWVGVLRRDGDGSDVRWARVDPCLVTHVLHAHDEGGGGGGGGGAGRGGIGIGSGTGDAVVLYVCRYEVPEEGQPVDPDVSVVGPAGIGMSLIWGGLPVLERWRVEGDRVERTQVDDRMVEYVTSDPLCEGGPFRYGYGVEVAPNGDRSVDREVEHLGLLCFDMARDEVSAWNPGPHRTASEPLFVRAVDGRSDNEGWLLTMVHDASRAATELYVLDASSLGRAPQAVVHLPESVALPFRSHGTWVGADRYR